MSNILRSESCGHNKHDWLGHSDYNICKRKKKKRAVSHPLTTSLILETQMEFPIEVAVVCLLSVKNTLPPGLLVMPIHWLCRYRATMEPLLCARLFACWGEQGSHKHEGAYGKSVWDVTVSSVSRSKKCQPCFGIYPWFTHSVIVCDGIVLDHYGIILAVKNSYESGAKNGGEV